MVKIEIKRVDGEVKKKKDDANVFVKFLSSTPKPPRLSGSIERFSNPFMYGVSNPYKIKGGKKVIR